MSLAEADNDPIMSVTKAMDASEAPIQPPFPHDRDVDVIEGILKKEVNPEIMVTTA